MNSLLGAFLLVAFWEQLVAKEPVALWIVLLVTGCSLQNGKNAAGRNNSQRPFPHSQLQVWNGGMRELYQSNHGMARNCEVSSFQCDSQSCQLLSYQPFPKCYWKECPQRPFLPQAPIHSLWDFFQWKGGIMELYQSNHGMARKRETGGFVISAVCE